jgi:hypothetical protein
VTVADRPDARALWWCIEPIHAVTYFAPESRRSLDAAGMRGFWMGYFGSRAAPLGAVGPAVVSATFFNFHQSMVRRAIPDAWSYATPESLVRARRVGSAEALRRILPAVGEQALATRPLLHRVIDAAVGSTRPLFSANRDLDPVDDPVEALWQACTTLREHRGDGHVAALTTAGLDGCEALVLFALSEGIPGMVFRESRGWTDAEWEAADRRLRGRGLVGEGEITAAGRALRSSIEEHTDELAGAAFTVLGVDERSVLMEGLVPVAAAVTGSGALPFPNPMGLPGPERA